MNPRESSILRAEIGRKLAASIDDAIASQLPDDFEELSLYAHRIRTCNSPNNQWFATDMHTPDGECFDGAGSFWSCGHKPCPSCIRHNARRNRKRVRRALTELPLRSGEYRNMITLTFPKTNLSVLQARAIIDYAWSLFRKRSWFKRTVLGGCKSEEFTVGKDGYHYHMHILAVTKWVMYATMRHEWTHCVRKAFEKAGLPLTIATSDQLIVANVKRVASLEGAVNEVCKYITCSDTWSRVPQADLLDICRITRFPRMFEIFGTWREFLKPSPVEADIDIPEILSLDTRSVTDEQDTRTWREHVRDRGAAAYLAIFDSLIGEAREFRATQLKAIYPYANFTRPKPVPDLENGIFIAKLDRLRRDHARLAEPRLPMVQHGFGRRIDIAAITALDPERMR